MRDARPTVAPTNRTPEIVQHVTESPRLAQPPGRILPAPTPTTNNHTETWVALDRWSRENRIGMLLRLSSSSATAFELLTRSGVLIVQANTLVAKWDSVQVHLGFQPQLIDGQPFVHQLDLRKNIEPLLHPFALPSRTNRVIVIDPGHGGPQSGATNVVNGVNEKEFTLDWARRLEPLLAERGWQVYLTRTDDTDVPLSDRVEFADEHKADLFISLHFNSAAPNRVQAGLETYCLTPTGMASTLTREFPDDPSLVFTNNAFDAENLQFAIRLHRAVLQASGLADRGVRRARFLTVLRGQNRPAILIEGGYLSNPREARQIDDPEFRQTLARAIADALTDRLEGVSPGSGTPVTSNAVAPGSLSSTNGEPDH